MSWLKKSVKKDKVESKVGFDSSDDLVLTDDDVERLKRLDDVEVEDISEIGEVVGIGEVEGDKPDAIVPVTSVSVPDVVEDGGQVRPSQSPVGGGGFDLGEETKAPDLIKCAVTGADGKPSLAMISKIRNSKPFTSVALVGDFSGELGLERRSRFRRKFLGYLYENNVAVKGDRAEKLLESAKIQLNHEADVEKRKGLKEEML